MKVKFVLILLTIITLNAIFSACENPLLSAPMLPGDRAGNNAAGMPLNVTATHGKKRSIELKWDEFPNAVRYHIYKADNPLMPFERCAETSSTQFAFTSVTPGSTVYYRVSAVAYNGTESEQSLYVMGSSLAQPLITDITDITEESAAVTWYMGNVSDDTYKASLLYTVYCFDGSAEKAQLALTGAALKENKLVFPGLSPNTKYQYQVEAYLSSDQGASEKSDKVDAATARRMRPGAPVNPRAKRGTAKDKIELTFELPDEVDIALGDNQYEKKPVYFVIQKRQYSASGTNVYYPACSYFGSISGPAREKSFDYIPGAKVTWTDNAVSRGVEYEYQVQSYVDDTVKVITSDSSKASAVGWALSEGSLSFGGLVYTSHEEQDLYTNAQLPLVFDFDPKGETYGYSLVEKIEPIGDGEFNDPIAAVRRPINTFTYNEIKNYAAQMDLTQKTTESKPGRGVYSYDVEIKLNGEIIDTVATIGKVEVSENTQPIIVEGFSVEDGYTDRFKFKWKYRDNRQYVIYASDDRNNWTDILTVNSNPNDNSTVENDNYSVTLTANSALNITPGLTKYFAIRPFRNAGGGTLKQGQMVYAPAASQTLGVPALSLGTEASYSVISATWMPVQKADTYRIKYWYTDGGSYETAAITAKIKKDALLINASGKFQYEFVPFANIEANKAGQEIQVAVDALNDGLWTAVGGSEISTSSKNTPVSTRLIGPALLAPNASRAVSSAQINVSWEGIAGAGGYYVFRRQFNMNNTAEEGAEAVVYYVPASHSSSINITGKNLVLDSSNIKGDTTKVKAAASFAGSRYTLNDNYLPDNEYDSEYRSHIPAYRDQQNDMAQGFSYRYFIVPVVNRGGAPEPLTSIEFVYAKDGSNKNTAISYYTIREGGTDIRYNGASAFEKEGFTIGFAQNVTATKGTYASSGNVNNGIEISWSLPPKLASIEGFSPRYTVYRRIYGGASWDTVASIDTLHYADTPEGRGTTYEYVVGISDSQPHASRRFIERCGTLRDERNRPGYLGYMLDMVKVVSVSRDARKVGDHFAEEVKWYSAGVKNPYNTDYNWGVDGYTIFLLNRNINNNRQWITLNDVPVNDLPNQTDQIYTAANDASNRLKVFRDYRHYFKVRSYVLKNDGEKVYCPDPAPGYTWIDGAEDEYVKWGARQISAEEFAAITALSIGTGMNWAGNNITDVPDRDSTQAGRLTIEQNGNYWLEREAKFNGVRCYFVTVNGTLSGRADAVDKTPITYGATVEKYTLTIPSGTKSKLSTLTITGPGDVGMYSGTVKIDRLDKDSTTGPYKVSYNGQNDYAVENKHYRTCFTFSENSKNYKRTRNFDWSPGLGIVQTSDVGPYMADKWWYPLSGSRAGWD